MPKVEELTVRCYVVHDKAKENTEAKTYYERIAPTLLPFDEYLKEVTKQEWLKKVAENIALHVYGVEGTATVSID